MAEARQVIDGERGRLAVVQVDAGEPRGAVGMADQHTGQAERAQHRKPRILRLDVHHQDGVDERGVPHAPHPPRLPPA